MGRSEDIEREILELEGSKNVAPWVILIFWAAVVVGIVCMVGTGRIINIFMTDKEIER